MDLDRNGGSVNSMVSIGASPRIRGVNSVKCWFHRYNRVTETSGSGAGDWEVPGGARGTRRESFRKKSCQEYCLCRTRFQIISGDGAQPRINASLCSLSTYKLNFSIGVVLARG